MTFIITLISLVIERFFYWGNLRQWRWFLRYQRWLSQSRINHWPSYVLLILCLLPPLLVVGFINFLLNGWLYGILKLLFGIAIFMYCLGPYNLWVQVYACIHELQKGDTYLAIEHANTAFKINVADNSEAFHQAFVRAIFLAAHQRIFGVLFWFVILGPVGAVFYRMIALLNEESLLNVSVLSGKIHRLLDWIPVRIFTFIFALGGHFTEVFVRFKKNALKGPAVNETLLVECGIAALDVPDDLVSKEGVVEKEALALLDRVFVMSLVILAVLVLLL
ncbi:MAG: hypothetical protein ACD_60C00141G0006 [uncultured bacterium]|nr:MAG: hypothetical protein ACD_60C00141G0006 [uncultured bacterium]